jgi:protein-tyrosine-phosphatase
MEGDGVRSNEPYSDGLTWVLCGGWMTGWVCRFVDWVIPDPKHMEPEEFNKVRDYIRGQIKGLLTELGVQTTDA